MSFVAFMKKSKRYAESVRARQTTLLVISISIEYILNLTDTIQCREQAIAVSDIRMPPSVVCTGLYSYT